MENQDFEKLEKEFEKIKLEKFSDDFKELENELKKLNLIFK